METNTNPVRKRLAIRRRRPQQSTITIKLDVMGVDESLEDSCDQLIGDHLEVWYEILDRNGPGGGWPVVAFTGPPAHIGILVYRYCGEDDEQAVELLQFVD